MDHFEKLLERLVSKHHDNMVHWKGLARNPEVSLDMRNIYHAYAQKSQEMFSEMEMVLDKYREMHAGRIA